MGLSRMLKINTPFIKIFLYVKLVGDNVCHLLELPDVEFPSSQNGDLENVGINAPSDTVYHLGEKSNAVFIYRKLGFWI